MAAWVADSVCFRATWAPNFGSVLEGRSDLISLKSRLVIIVWADTE